jgi:hypothetical protein
MDWLESGVFWTVRVDGCASNNHAKMTGVF